MNRELRERICDYFTGPELAELLGATALDVLYAIEAAGDISDETIADLEEIMLHGTGR